jgi:hypothetical protein
MNIAFPALFIFLLILPGFAFRTGFRKTEKTNLEHKPFAEATFLSVLSAMFLHFIWISLAGLITHYYVDYKTAFTLLIGQRGVALDDAIATAMQYPYAIFSYHFSLLLCSWILGVGLRAAVVKFKWDCNGRFPSSLLKFDTPWYYLFNGTNTGKNENLRSPVDGVFISAIVPLNKENVFLYTGILLEYYFDKDGMLERLILTGASRRRIEDDKKLAPETAGMGTTTVNHEDSFYPIDGDCLVLRYSEIITLNIQYLCLTLADDTDAD